jgi:hypothetical protein
MRFLLYHSDQRPLNRIARRIFFASVTAAAFVIILWLISYRMFLHGSIDIQSLGKRFQFSQPKGGVFFEWLEIRRTPQGGLDQTYQVELDGLLFGFGFYTWPGQWTRAGEVAIPHWALLILALLPAMPAVFFYNWEMKQRKWGRTKGDGTS